MSASVIVHSPASPAPPCHERWASESPRVVSRAISSGSWSQTVVPCSTLPARGMAPARCSSASASVVLPAPAAPTRATVRWVEVGTEFMRPPAPVRIRASIVYLSGREYQRAGGARRLGRRVARCLARPPVRSSAARSTASGCRGRRLSRGWRPVLHRRRVRGVLHRVCWLARRSRGSDAQTQPEARSCVTVRSGLLRVPAQIG